MSHELDADYDLHLCPPLSIYSPAENYSGQAPFTPRHPEYSGQGDIALKNARTNKRLKFTIPLLAKSFGGRRTIIQKNARPRKRPPIDVSRFTFHD